MKFLTYLSLVLMLFLVSCSDDEDSTTGPITKNDTANIIQPFAVGNYWVYQSIMPTGVKNARTEIIAKEEMTYKGEKVTLYKVYQETNTQSLVSKTFVYDDFCYVSNNTSGNEITDATKTFIYRYTGQKQVEFNGSMLTASMGKRVFKGKEIDVLKLENAAQGLTLYFKLGLGMIEEIQSFPSMNLEVSVNLTDYNIE